MKPTLSVSQSLFMQSTSSLVTEPPLAATVSFPKAKGAGRDTYDGYHNLVEFRLASGRSWSDEVTHNSSRDLPGRGGSDAAS